MARVRRGDVLVVARLDRLARSLSHLLSVIAELDAKGAHFKSLADPIDTTTPQGRFALQVLAVAELERALIQERTKDGLRAAKTRPRRRQSQTARRRSRRHQANCRRQSPAYFERVNRTAEHWLPIVKEMRPDHRWQDVVRMLNAKRDRSNGPPLPLWSVERLKRAVKRFVAEGLADPALLQPAGAQVQQRTAGDARRRRQARQSGADPGANRRALEAMYERTPRGGTRWSPSSVKSLLDRAEKLGLFGAETL